MNPTWLTTQSSWPINKSLIPNMLFSFQYGEMNNEWQGLILFNWWVELVYFFIDIGYGRSRSSLWNPSKVNEVEMKEKALATAEKHWNHCHRDVLMLISGPSHEHLSVSIKCFFRSLTTSQIFFLSAAQPLLQQWKVSTKHLRTGKTLWETILNIGKTH